MKRYNNIVQALVLLVFLGVLGFGQPNREPPDVFLKWTDIQIPLVSPGPQDITFTLPTSGISKYSFHYVYLFMTGGCNANALASSTTGTLTGVYVNNPNANGVIPLGGLVTEDFAEQDKVNGLNPVLLLKGNGAVSSISGTLHLVSVSNISSCKMNVLYKATIREEEGVRTSGVYAPSDIIITNLVNPFSTAAFVFTNLGALGDWTFTIPTLGEAGFKAAVALDSIYICVNPNVATGLYRITTPVVANLEILGSQAGHIIGSYSTTNSCINVNAGGLSLGILPATDSGALRVHFLAPVGSGFPQNTNVNAELTLTAFGHVVY